MTKCALCGFTSDSARLVVRDEHDNMRLVITVPANDCDPAMDRVYGLLDRDPSCYKQIECRSCSKAIAKEQALEAEYLQEEMRKYGVYSDQDEE